MFGQLKKFWRSVVLSSSVNPYDQLFTDEELASTKGEKRRKIKQMSDIISDYCSSTSTIEVNLPSLANNLYYFEQIPCMNYKTTNVKPK